MQKKKLELLSPAKNAEYGRAAIDHGADAVYIGAERFSARSAAGNTIDDISGLIEYAHLYSCRVYTAVNTVLYDDELDDARDLINKLYEIKSDGVIIQDMALLAMELPPIPLHASTQMHNISADRINFLESCGIKRAILARELSLEEIKTISQTTSIELEAFVHGALCVSYSGQCYMSFAAGGRSANRGNCAQPCRKLYNLSDSNGHRLIENKHLLSLKDMCRDQYLADLVAAGITSFKIEGRLKGISYVKNVTAHYRRKLDNLINKDITLAPSSSGTVNHFFEPDPEKTFNRGYTDYFLTDRGGSTHLRSCRQPISPGSDPCYISKSLLAGTSKSIGKKIGKLDSIDRDIIKLESAEPNPATGSEPFHQKLNAGDGICFFDRDSNLQGFRIEKILQNGYRVSDTTGLVPGTVLFRNHDHLFEKKLEGKSAERRIPVKIEFHEKDGEYYIKTTDDLYNGVRASIPGTAAPAQDTERTMHIIRTQLTKLGDTPFHAEDVIFHVDNIPFFPVSALNEARRQAVTNLARMRIDNYVVSVNSSGVRAPNTHPYPCKQMDYHANVTNHLSRRFYLDHGCTTEDGFELLQLNEELEIMTTRMCLKHELGWCIKNNRSQEGSEPLFLEDDSHRYRLEFDCARCVMRIIYTGRIK